jgi:integrase
LNKAATEFETACIGGKIVNATKLEAFIEKWFKVHESALKPATLKKYRDCCPRIFSQLGHIRIDKLKTTDIDEFLIWLADERNAAPLAKCKIDIKQALNDRGETQKAFAERAGISAQCIRSCYHDTCIKWDNAVKISTALEMPPTAVFEKIIDDSRLSPKTIRCYHGFLSTIFNYAVKVGEISVNPCENCTLPKMTAPKHKILSIEQAQQFLQLLDEHAPLKYRCFFNIAVYGGLRRGEILALRWSDIDFDNSLIHINRAVHWDKSRGYYYTDPKTAKSMRTIKLSERVMFMLKQQHNEQLSNALNFGDYWKNTGDLVFTADNGDQMSMATPYTYLTKFCKEYDLPKISVHSLRHLNATLLINSGANPKTVQSLLGHSLASTTLNIYAHEIQSAEAAASTAVAAMLDSRLSDNCKAK